MPANDDFEVAKARVKSVLDALSVDMDRDQTFVEILFGSCVVVLARDGVRREHIHRWIDSLLAVNAEALPKAKA